MPDRTQPLREEDADPDPLRQFTAWFAEAIDIGIALPEAAALATATPDGRPSVRMVLVKSQDARGFVFFTNYDSRKGLELAANPHAALVFHWPALGRQARIEGTVQRTSAEETAAYVRSRARGSQLSALASPQSQPVASRAELEARVAAVSLEYAENDLPLSEQWGGYRLAPASYEFWQQREDRLHDRLLYVPAADGWSIVRLAP